MSSVFPLLGLGLRPHRLAFLHLFARHWLPASQLIWTELSFFVAVYEDGLEFFVFDAKNKNYPVNSPRVFPNPDHVMPLEKGESK
jgi:hypothetical protein